MSASEFWEASRKAEIRGEAILCYHRARELMGVFEIIDLGDSAIKLYGFYRFCTFQRLFREDRLKPSFIKQFATGAAKAFERAAEELACA